MTFRFFEAMSRKNKKPLTERVAGAAEAALAARGHLTVLDVFLRIGWLNPTTVEDWRRGRIECLERAVTADASRISEAMALIRSWAKEKDLAASSTDYVARTPQRQALRFSLSGAPAIEAAWRAHWVTPALSEKQRERLTEQTSRAPELVAVVPSHSEWACHRCGGTGDLLIMENPGPACLRCVGLDDLEFLPAGDALISRRVKARSTRYAVVVRFSRTRRRYERQGLLAEPQVLAAVKRDLEAQPRKR